MGLNHRLPSETQALSQLSYSPKPTITLTKSNLDSQIRSGGPPIVKKLMRVSIENAAIRFAMSINRSRRAPS